MEYKLKHLSRFCCRPANELEFETVKMAAEIGGVEKHSLLNWNSFYHWFRYVKMENDSVALNMGTQETELISVLDFCNKLRMTEEEAEKLEDDRVEFHLNITYSMSEDRNCLIPSKGRYFKTNEDGTEVTLHKR